MTRIVSAPLVIVRDGAGAFHHLYAGQPVPDGLDADHVNQLIAEGMITDGDQPAGDEPGTVEEVLAAVGDDPAKAAAALDAEKASAKPRKTLVDKLTGIVEG